ncbi:MAG: PAS domain-containing protein, partial [Cyanobacteria bacterium J06632_3]
MITADHSTNHANIDDVSTLNPIAVYDAVWNDLQDGMYALAVLEEGADFRFIAFNQAVVKYSILPTQDLIGKRLSEALPPERVERYCQHYNQC